MTGFQKILQNMAENGDERADKLLMESLDYDEKTLPSFVALHDKEISEVLNIPGITGLVNADPNSEDAKKMLDVLNEYTKLRNQGRGMYAQDASEKLDVYGKSIPTVDDFMKAFGVNLSNGEGEDDARAAFTNPENDRYWGKYSDAEKNLAAYQMGYKDFREMEGDINRAANAFQTRNQVEGYGPNNELQPVAWAVSALKGLATPRIKEAQASGREITWQDVAGDIAELGLNFVPGVGLVGKGGKVLARIGPKAELVGKGIGLGVESFSVPFMTQAMDAGLLYNPNTLGTEASGLNARSEFSLPAMAAQAGGIAGAKGAIKGGAGMAKNAMETSMGEETGKKGFKQAFDYVERIGESTDDLIARRQAMLDRKAELAKQKENIEKSGDTRVSAQAVDNGGYADPNDIYNAESYRILTDEAKKFGRTQKLREAYENAQRAREQAADNYRRAESEADQVRIEESFEKNIEAFDEDGQARLAQASPRYREALAKLEQARQEMHKADQAQLLAQKEYSTAAAPERPFVMLDDGRFVYDHRGTVGGQPWGNTYWNKDSELYSADFRPGGDANYTRLPPNTVMTMVEPGEGLGKESSRKMSVVSGYNIDNPNPFTDDWGVFNYEQTVKPTPREPATLKAIQRDDLLSRKLDPYNTAKETARDVGGNAVFNAMAREGIVGNIDALNEKRDRALWNRQLWQLRPLVLEKGLSLDERKRRQEAVMNVMTYGLDGIPTEIYMRDSDLYKAIAGLLGASNWKHASEYSVPVVPTNSTSTAQPLSSSSGY